MNRAERTATSFRQIKNTASKTFLRRKQPHKGSNSKPGERQQNFSNYSYSNALHHENPYLPIFSEKKRPAGIQTYMTFPSLRCCEKFKIARRFPSTDISWNPRITTWRMIAKHIFFSKEQLGDLYLPSGCGKSFVDCDGITESLHTVKFRQEGEGWCKRWFG